MDETLSAPQDDAVKETNWDTDGCHGHQDGTNQQNLWYQQPQYSRYEKYCYVARRLSSYACTLIFPRP